MKKCMTVIVAMIIVLVLQGFAYADFWYPANQSTLGWDHEAAVTLPDGTVVTIPQQELSYQVFRTLATAPDKDQPEFLGPTPEKTFLVRFAEEGRYLLGVRAVRTIEGVEKPVVSTISWSDDPAQTHDSPFGVEFFVPPAAPVGVRAE
jgi:hypothetical protein